MKTKHASFSMTVAEIKHWMIVMRQLTAGGTPRDNNRERWQKFRWAMMQNHARLQAAWDERAQEIEKERILILTECCGGTKRYEAYQAEMHGIFESFKAYRNASGQFAFSKNQNSVQRRFTGMVEELNARFADVGKAQKKFVARQQEMLAVNATLELICCDYDEVPDDVGCAYISFIRPLLMGMPKLRFWHAVLLRESRTDPQVAELLVGKINAAIEAGIEAKKLSSEITMDVFRALYEDPKIDAPKEEVPNV